jgi:hypothetical protein
MSTKKQSGEGVRKLVLQITRRPDGKVNIDSDLPLPDLIEALKALAKNLEKQRTTSGLYLPNGFERKLS